MTYDITYIRSELYDKMRIYENKTMRQLFNRTEKYTEEDSVERRGRIVNQNAARIHEIFSRMLKRFEVYREDDNAMNIIFRSYKMKRIHFVRRNI